MQTKTTTYVTAMAINNHSVHLLRPNDSRNGDSRAFTKEENEIFKILSKNNHDSIWGEAIKLCIKAVREKSDYKKFRDLIKSLQAQAKDNKSVMIKILGEEGYSVLCKVSHA